MEHYVGLVVSLKLTTAPEPFGSRAVVGIVIDMEFLIRSLPKGSPPRPRQIAPISTNDC
jgi:hypothetical protein